MSVLLVSILPRWPTLSAVTICTTVAMLLGNPAIAAETSKKAPTPVRQSVRQAEPNQPEPRPIEPLLTRDQLRACMALQAQNKERGFEVTRMQSEIKAENDEARRVGEVLATDLTTLDRSNLDAVNAYNQRVADRSRRVDDLQAKAAEFNARVQAYNDGLANHARECQNRKFDERDEKALLKGS